jgi:hypothetical protein
VNIGHANAREARYLSYVWAGSAKAW